MSASTFPIHASCRRRPRPSSFLAGVAMLMLAWAAPSFAATAPGPVKPATALPGAAAPAEAGGQPVEAGKAQPPQQTEESYRPLGPPHLKPRHNWIAPWSKPRPRMV